MEAKQQQPPAPISPPPPANETTTKGKLPVLPAAKPVPLPMGRGGVKLHDVPELHRYAKAIKDSAFVPTDMRGNEGSIMAAIELGLELGLPPMRALQSIMVVHGRPSLWGDALLAVCMASGRFEFDAFREWTTGNPYDDDHTAHITVQRIGTREPTETTYSVADAKRAKLWGKKTKRNEDTPWIATPQRMLKYRARAFALRDAFPDVLSGCYDRDEMLDVTRMREDIMSGLDLSNPETTADMTDEQLTESMAVATGAASTEPNQESPSPDATPPSAPAPVHPDAKELGELRARINTLYPQVVKAASADAANTALSEAGLDGPVEVAVTGDVQLLKGAISALEDRLGKAGK